MGGRVKIKAKGFCAGEGSPEGPVRSIADCNLGVSLTASAARLGEMQNGPGMEIPRPLVSGAE